MAERFVLWFVYGSRCRFLMVFYRYSGKVSVGEDWFALLSANGQQFLCGHRCCQGLLGERRQIDVDHNEFAGKSMSQVVPSRVGQASIVTTVGLVDQSDL